MRTIRSCLFPLLVTLLVCTLNTRTAGAQAQDWQPAKTWVFVVGTLQWKDSASFGSFDPKNRRDAEVVQFFRSQGVPREQIVYLQDRAATTARIEQSLGELLERTTAGDLLFLYYCGHGYKEGRDGACFASYDTGGSVKGWSIASIPVTIEARFKGSRAFLAADCCYSGVLGAEVKRQASRVSFACLTSSSASQLSTGNWTFTEALLDGLRGAPGCDLDGSGGITLAELAAYVREDMAFGEEQLATFTVTGAFRPQTRIAAAPKKSHPRVGERVEVKYQGKYWKARITGTKDGRFWIHWLGFRDYPDELVAASLVRIPEVAAQATPAYKVGRKVEVIWKNEWYPATILKTRGRVFLIHYTGYGDEWDEWVSSKRIRLPE